MNNTSGNTETMIVVGFDDPAPIERWASADGFTTEVAPGVPDAETLAKAGNVVVHTDAFGDLPLRDLGDHDVRIWSSTGQSNPFAAPLPGWAAATKRAIDLIVAVGFLVVASPILAAVAAAIKLTSSGPIFHVQTRLGVDGRWFEMYKFRTMTVDNDESQHLQYFEDFAQGGEVEQTDGLYKIVGDPRITKVGQLLRTYSIDEVPQFLNVLRGDMTIVGPRPMLPRELRVLDGRSWQRMRVQPGITGLWQVSGRSLTTFERMIELDLDYWQSWSLRRELTILLQTPGALLRAETA